MLVCELLRANLYEFQQHNRRGGDPPYFTLPRIQSIAQQARGSGWAWFWVGVVLGEQVEVGGVGQLPLALAALRGRLSSICTSLENSTSKILLLIIIVINSNND